MIASGALLRWRESAGRPVGIGTRHWFMVVLGGLMIIASFCWDYRNVMAGGMPNPFPWSIFLTGETIGLAGFTLAVLRDRPRTLR